MAGADVEVAPAVEPQNDSNDTKNGESKADNDVSPNSEKRDSRSNGNSRSHHDDRKSKQSNRKREDFRKNVKTNYAALPESSDPDEIRKQVEFYFSDSNLSYDDYMSSLVGGAANQPVPIKTIHSFKRMRRFQPFSAVVAALKDSKVLDVIDDEDIKRKVPYVAPEEAEDEFNDPTIPRAIYAKGFGDEGTSTQFDIENFFAPYGPVSGVRLRRQLPSRTFKGSVFVEFESEELQQEFLALEDKPKWNGEDLTYMSKREYCEMKLKDIKDGKIQPNKKHQYKQYLPRSQHSNRDRDSNNNGRDRDSRRGGDRDRDRNRRGGDRKDRRRDRDDWRGRREDFQRNGYRSKSPEDKEEAKKDEGKVEESKKRERDEAVDGGEEDQKEAKKVKNSDTE